MAHGKLSPSKAHRWLSCPGSQFFNDNGGPESSYAEEGSHAHAILEKILKDIPVLTDDIVGGKPAAAHRIQQAIEIRDWVNQWKQAHPDFVVESETPVPIAKALNQPGRADDLDGTADVAAWNGKEVMILDAKFGFVQVQPDNNPQLYLYAIGVITELWSIFGPKFLVGLPITVVIAQPDYEGVVQFREHRMTIEHLEAWWKKNNDNIVQAIKGSAKLNPSEEACHYCPARNTCQPRQEILVKFVQEEWRMTKTLGELLPVLGLVRHIADDLETQAAKMLAEGQSVPGYKLVESRSIRKWDDERNIDLMLSATNQLQVTPDAIMADPKLLSPAQMEKKFKAKGKALTKEFAITPVGRPKLVPDSDPRPALEPGKDFTQEEIDSMLEEE